MLSHDGGDRWVVSSSDELAAAELWLVNERNIPVKQWYLENGITLRYFQLVLTLANADAWVVTDDGETGTIAHIVNGKLVRKWTADQDQPDLTGVRLEVAASAIVLFHAKFCQGRGCCCGA